MTGEYTFVAPERQNELTRRIQEKLANVGAKSAKTAAEPAAPPPPPSPPATTPEGPLNFVDTAPVTPLVQ